MERVEQFILIDDNEVTNFFNQDILMSMDPAWTITSFTEVDKALAYLAERTKELAGRKTLVFLDIKMPERTGFDLIRELEELDLADNPDLRFCMLSSSTLVRDQEELHKFPTIQQYIEKPLNAEKVQRALEVFAPAKK
jgi:CitB family two-component system response regulator MalR